MTGESRGILLFNPCAGSQDASRMGAIAERLEGALALEVCEITSNDDAAARAREAVARGVEVVVAAGGDGTVSACAGAVIGSSAALGIVPCGTSNSIARALGMPVDLPAACDAIASGGVRRIDAAFVNGHAMVLMATIGIHAETIGSTPPEQKAALGKLAYVMHAVGRLAEATPFEAVIETERGSAGTTAMALTLANLAPRESIWAHGAPDLVPDDGLLDLTIASAESALGAALAALELAVSAVTGTEAASPRVGWLRCARARVVATPPQPVLVDGDVIGVTPMDVAVVPRGLAIRVAG